MRRGTLAHPDELGYVVQFAEVTATTKTGARGLVLPPKLEAGSTPRTPCSPAPSPRSTTSASI
ncbi:MAG: hypothetical protein ACYCUG_18255 [Acidimicrobiales bacterium]